MTTDEVQQIISYAYPLIQSEIKSEYGEMGLDNSDIILMTNVIATIDIYNSDAESLKDFKLERKKKDEKNNLLNAIFNKLQL